MKSNIGALPPPVRNELSVTERDAAVKALTPPKRKLAVLFIGISSGCTVVNALMPMLRADRTFASLTIGGVLLCAAVLSFAGIWFAYALTRAKPLVDGPFRIAFLEHGIAIESSTSRVLRWRDIASAKDVDGAIVVSDRRTRILILPKRLFADDGREVWSYLEGHLLGTKLLLRSYPTSTIVNTASA